MNAIDYQKTIHLKIKHSHGKKVPGSSLNSGLKYRAANKSVAAPLPAVSVLGMDDNAHFLTTPRSGEQIELWPLPADKSA